VTTCSVEGLQRVQPGEPAASTVARPSRHVRDRVPAVQPAWMLEGDYQQWQYRIIRTTDPAAPLIPGCVADPGDQACVTVLARSRSTFVPAFTAREYDFDARFGLKIADPRIYIASVRLAREQLRFVPEVHGFVSVRRSCRIRSAFSVYGSIYYFPTISGNYTVPRPTRS